MLMLQPQGMAKFMQDHPAKTIFIQAGKWTS
jgi:hypothetical protein